MGSDRPAPPLRRTLTGVSGAFQSVRSDEMARALAEVQSWIEKTEDWKGRKTQELCQMRDKGEQTLREFSERLRDQLNELHELRDEVVDLRLELAKAKGERAGAMALAGGIPTVVAIISALIAAYK